MIEELSLRNNRGSLLFQKRQRRVQKFTFELSESLQGVSEPLCAPGETKPRGSQRGPLWMDGVGGGGGCGPFVHPLDYVLGC